MAKRVNKASVILAMVMCGCVLLSACGTTDMTKAAAKNSENVEILSAGENAIDVDGAFEDTDTDKSSKKQHEFSDADWNRTLGELTQNGDIGFEFLLGDGGQSRVDSENIESVEEIPVDYSMTFDELTNHGTAEYVCEMGSEVGYKTVFKATEK